MTKSWIKTWIAAGLVTASATYGETLYQKDGISLEGSVRMVHRNAATCQVLEENESTESYERTRSNHGQPLNVWRLDYSVLNGSGWALSDVTAHFQIEAEWPPCTNWTGLGQYPGPVQWAGSFETIQRAGGLEPGGEAAATTYVLAFDGMQPRFGRRKVAYRFGEVTATSEPAPEPVAPELPPRPGDTFRDCEECPEMVVMPSGRLALGRYETTVGEYRAFASATGGGGDAWRDPDFAQTDRHPVTLVSWDDVQAYVSWLPQSGGGVSAADGGGMAERGCWVAAGMRP